ncbi:hypothetical protein SAMN05445871_1819 [Paraburkholderia caballeronis]|uniref:Uncharacterized protein n=1 Tax=Paraburkholderia caballeronis TaxID=416943 RepID=A0A1H7J3H3_9BURK|nr:hypothetical protein C7403_103494 [Paraburkholderia caballeronis]PXX03054.1 hypothetical protein C7407_103494 [Paraburkholderia caballeronis]RAK03779.1 hypothetical protein C7409_103494 [Paraburkholderia caballeronis]SEC19950.1 hypothetical protein SAMN05445871_1819 [Paraburkholderia caballeronis]SEK69146.1 hypothetical protein SAMN05192542_103124 [Paraburkholderia caballeronis]
METIEVKSGERDAFAPALDEHLPAEDPQGPPDPPHQPPPPQPGDDPPPVPEGDPPSEAPPERAARWHHRAALPRDQARQASSSAPGSASRLIASSRSGRLNVSSSDAPLRVTENRR